MFSMACGNSFLGRARGNSFHGVRLGRARGNSFHGVQAAFQAHNTNQVRPAHNIFLPISLSCSRVPRRQSLILYSRVPRRQSLILHSRVPRRQSLILHSRVPRRQSLAPQNVFRVNHQHEFSHHTYTQEFGLIFSGQPASDTARERLRTSGIFDGSSVPLPKPDATKPDAKKPDEVVPGSAASTGTPEDGDPEHDSSASTGEQGGTGAKEAGAKEEQVQPGLSAVRQRRRVGLFRLVPCLKA